MRSTNMPQTIGHSAGAAMTPASASSDPFWTGSPAAGGGGRSRPLEIPPRTSSRPDRRGRFPPRGRIPFNTADECGPSAAPGAATDAATDAPVVPAGPAASSSTAGSLHA